MHRLVLSLATCVVLAAAVPAQGSHVDLQTIGAPTLRSLRAAEAEILTAFDLGAAQVVSMDLPSAIGMPFETPMVVEGTLVNLELVPHEMRAANYRLLVQDEAGVHEVEPSPTTTYRGVVNGMPGSLVTASLVDGQLNAMILLGDEGPLYAVQPLARVFPEAPSNEHVVYRSFDVALSESFSCGNVGDRERTGESPRMRQHVSGGGGAAGGSAKVAEIGLDADVQFYEWNSSSVPATENDMTNVMNNVDAIYSRDVDIEYEITTILVRTAEPDPYSTSDAGGLLNQFENEWNFFQGGIQRDVAHLFTGRNLSGTTIGIAGLGTVCDVNDAYGLSESNFSFALSSRVELTAHELGHSWGSGHCSSAASDCRIMCSGLGGCNGVTNMFGSSASNAITSYKNSHSGCLDNAIPPSPPILTGLSVGSSPIFGGVAVTATGFFFDDADAVHVGGATIVSPFFTTVNDNQILFTMPVGTALGPVAVTVSSGAGTSGAQNITYVAQDPPQLRAPTTAFTSLAYRWDLAADPEDFWFLLVSSSPTTVPIEGVSILASNAVLLRSGQLDVNGLVSTQINVKQSLQGATVHSQAVMLDDVDFSLSSTNVVSALFVF